MRGQSGGCGVRVGALRAPHLGPARRSEEGLEGAKAHSKAERLPVKVEGTRLSLSRYCAPLLSSGRFLSSSPGRWSFSLGSVGPFQRAMRYATLGIGLTSDRRDPRCDEGKGQPSL